MQDNKKYYPIKRHLSFIEFIRYSPLLGLKIKLQRNKSLTRKSLNFDKIVDQK